MSETNHGWCRDVRRDEAIRAAEDAAAVPSIMHRDLPEVVADLRERVARLEAAQATLGSGDEIARLTAERDAAIRERDAAKAKIDGKDSALLGCAEQLRSTRDERDAAREECERLRGASKGSGVFDANGDEVPWQGVVAALTAERDMLRRCPECNGEGKHDSGGTDASGEWISLPCEGCACTGTLDGFVRESEKLSARVAELEAAAAPAANASVEKQQPVGYGVRTEWGQFRAGLYTSQRAPANLERGDEVVPLYDAPQPPRGWLTENERAAVESARDYFDAPEHDDDECAFLAAALRSLLARSTPPKVKRPNPNVVITTVDARERIDRQWIAAIRAAGGEVEG